MSIKQHGVNDTFPCKAMKRQRLGRFTEWVLARRGKRGAASGAVRKDANGTIFLSVFVAGSGEIVLVKAVLFGAIWDFTK